MPPGVPSGVPGARLRPDSDGPLLARTAGGRPASDDSGAGGAIAAGAGTGTIGVAGASPPSPQQPGDRMRPAAAAAGDTNAMASAAATATAAAVATVVMRVEWFGDVAMVVVACWGLVGGPR